MKTATLDEAIGTYLSICRESYPKISINEILDQFHISEQNFRESLIRFFFKGRIFGIIHGETLLFTDEHQGSLGLEEILEENILKYDLAALIKQSDPNSLQIESGTVYEDDSLEFEDLSTGEVEISRTKEISEKDKIMVEVQFGVASYKIAIKCSISNASDEKIYDSKIKMKRHSLLELIEIKPKTQFSIEENEIWIDLGDMLPTSTKFLNLYFRPKSDGPVSISGIFQYRNLERKIRLMRMGPVNYNLIFPEFTPADIPTKEIKSFMKDEKKIKNFAGFGRPESLMPHEAQIIMESVLSSLNFKRISSIVKEDLFMTFFFGEGYTTKGKSFQVLLVPQVKKEIMGFYVCCEYEQVVSNLLRNLSIRFQNELINKSLILEDEGLVDLNCIKCGALLEFLPPQGTAITCKKCYTLQKPW